MDLTVTDLDPMIDENLSAFVPIEIDAIETLMKEQRIPIRPP